MEADEAVRSGGTPYGLRPYFAALRTVPIRETDGGGGSGKSSTTPKKTPAPSSASNPPRAYTNPYQEYAEQRRAATTPSAQDYAQLMRSGAHMSYAQYAYEKSHTVFPSFVDYMNGKQTGRPYYTTVSQGKPSKVPYQRSYFTGSRTSPSVAGVTNAPGYDCGLNINALGAGDYGAEQAEIGLLKTGKILFEVGKTVFKAIELRVGVGQGIGFSGDIDIGADSFGVSFQTSANYAEFRFDDGELGGGQYYRNEAYIELFTGKLGIAHNEIADWNGNWELDEQSSFVLGTLTSSIGFDVSAYLIVGGSISAELNLAEILYALPDLIERIKEIAEE